MERCVVISIMLMNNVSDIVEYGRRRLELPSTTVDIEYDNNDIEIAFQTRTGPLGPC